MAFWQRHPPVHRMVAAYLGIEADDSPAGNPTSDENFIEFFQAMTGQLPP